MSLSHNAENDAHKSLGVGGQMWNNELLALSVNRPRDLSRQQCGELQYPRQQKSADFADMVCRYSALSAHLVHNNFRFLACVKVSAAWAIAVGSPGDVWMARLGTGGL